MAIAAAPAGTWSADSITDEGFRARFVTVPQIIEDWVAPYGPLRGKSLLDFGCGHGTSALAFALRHEVRVAGVDIMPDPEECLPRAMAQLGLDALPPNLSLRRVKPGEVHDGSRQFDLVYSWSVFEHVDQRVMASVLSGIHRCLAPSGLLFVQVAPLYYSAEGSHLVHRLSEPWVHLSHQHNALYDALVAAVPDAAEVRELWSTYETLNRITGPELVDAIAAAGFDILQTHYTQDKETPPKRLTQIFDSRVLTTNQVALLARRR